MQGRMMELERENQALLELRKEYVHMRDRASEASSPCRSSVRESDQKVNFVFLGFCFFFNYEYFIILISLGS